MKDTTRRCNDSLFSELCGKIHQLLPPASARLLVGDLLTSFLAMSYVTKGAAMKRLRRRIPGAQLPGFDPKDTEAVFRALGLVKPGERFINSWK